MFATLPPSNQNPRSSFLTSESQTQKSSAPVSSRIEFDRTENNSEAVPRQEDPMGLQLPAGFRFHPTDEELVTHYLMKKVLEVDFTAIAIAEVDMNKVEPWELPWKAKLGESEWYFFCVTDKKYPTGLRKNRATPCGYWKATGKDKEIFDSRKALAGMKKTLVFYNGRAPKGVKTDWVCHEYRLEGENSPKSSKDDWVISRVFQKASGGKKVRISGPTGTNSLEPNEAITQPNPPLVTDPSPSQGVPCFSNNVPEEDGAMINSNDHNYPLVVGSSASNPITDPLSPLTKQFDDFADLIEGFDEQFPGSVSSLHDDPLSVGQNQVGGYLDYDADEGFVWREEKKNMISGPQENTAAAVRTEDPLVAPNLEMGKENKSFGGEEEARVGELYDIGGFWDFANI